jgi:hypothetical protein
MKKFSHRDELLYRRQVVNRSYRHISGKMILFPIATPNGKAQNRKSHPQLRIIVRPFVVCGCDKGCEDFISEQKSAMEKAMMRTSELSLIS